MTILQAIILGVVEGITEFLPVSSTGHLIIATKLLGIVESDFVKSFGIIIQLGAIFAVVILFRKKLLHSWSVWLKMIVAFIPSAIIGLALYSVIKTYLLGNSAVVLWALFLGGIALIVFEYWKKGDDGREVESLTYKECFLIGIAQVVALIPGVSRSAATIVAGRGLRLSRAAAVEFSFLLSIPTMVAATGLDIVSEAGSFSGSDVTVLLVGFTVSFIVALLSIIGFMRFIKTHTFVPFGIYRIIIGIVFFAVFFI